uniref:Uncharacterized protein n=1 Tax=Knipowitschia caucasica TaxID=637954 RepID=A0AAV2L6S1_KNICA
MSTPWSGPAPVDPDPCGPRPLWTQTPVDPDPCEPGPHADPDPCGSGPLWTRTPVADGRLRAEAAHDTHSPQTHSPSLQIINNAQARRSMWAAGGGEVRRKGGR